MVRGNPGTRDERTPGAVSRVPMTRHLEQTGGFDETAVVERARNGDFRAFTELVERYEASIFRLARHFTPSQRDAEEALQETFLEAWEELGELRGNSGFRPWLIRIAVRQARMRLGAQENGRAAWRDEPGEVEGEPDRALESLHPDLRAVFVLRDVEGIRTEDTAAMLRLTVQAVRGRLLRARMQIGQTQFRPRVLS